MTNETHTNEKVRLAALMEACVVTNLRRTTRIVTAYHDDLLRPAGLHINQLPLLVAPYLHDGITINAMAKEVDLDRTTLVRNLKVLQEMGIVVVRSGDDLRTRQVSLTEQGRQVLLRVLPHWEAAQAQMIASLADQHASFMAALATLNELESRD